MVWLRQFSIQLSKSFKKKRLHFKQCENFAVANVLFDTPFYHPVLLIDNHLFCQDSLSRTNNVVIVSFLSTNQDNLCHGPDIAAIAAILTSLVCRGVVHNRTQHLLDETILIMLMPKMPFKAIFQLDRYDARFLH